MREEGESFAVSLKIYDGIGQTIICKTRIGLQQFPLLGGEDER
jgi:hypothetical protein